MAQLYSVRCKRSNFCSPCSEKGKCYGEALLSPCGVNKNITFAKPCGVDGTIVFCTVKTEK